MLESLSSYRPFGKKILALEHTKQGTKPLIFGLELVQKKGELDIHQTFRLNLPGEIEKIIKTATPGYVVITDDQILSKEISQTGTDTEILAEAFPNLNLNDFYYQILRTSTTSFIAVCRKQYVEALLASYQKTTVKVIGVHLGELKAVALSNYVKNDVVNTNTSNINYVDGAIVSMTLKRDTVPEEYVIEGLTFSSTHTMPLAVALDEVLQNDRITGNIQHQNSGLQKQYRESLFFTKTLQIGVGFLLLALLINFFVFNAKYKKWQVLQEELQVFTTQKEQIKNKQSDVNTKEALVQSIRTTGFSKSSYYIDQMIQLLPNTVVLNSFTYQPLEKPIRKDKTIDLRTDVISITGKSTDKEGFTTWLRAVEGLSFIETVTIAQYGVDKKNTSGFELTITIKPDGTTN